MFRLVAICVLLILLSGCARYSLSSPGAQVSKMTEEKLFVDGERALANGDNHMAVRYLEALDNQYPFGKYAEQAQLDLIYAYYKKGETAATVAAATRYIHLYPRSKNVDYAYYMKGVADFEQDRGAIMKYLPIDSSLRDPGTARNAFNDFSILIRRFPKSKYVADARQRMIYLTNLFAQTELNVAKYYFDRKAYVAAANRASFLLENYSQAQQSEAALVVLVKSKRKLGLQKSADEALAVLAATYPNSHELEKL